MTNNNIERLLTQLHQAVIDNGGVECQQVPEAFFESEILWENQVAERKLAKEICNRCPVMAECFTYGMVAQEPYGIWGGTTPDERRNARNKSRRATLRNVTD